jgi:uncharacterized protein
VKQVISRTEAITFVAVVVLLSIFFSRSQTEPLFRENIPLGFEKAEIELNGRVFQVAVANTPEAERQGLSGQEHLSPESGMWFDFGSENLWGIWMKDMKFPIDIIWFDKNLEIVSVKEDVSPETFPESFFPTRPAAYVLELPAGTVEKLSLQVGNHAKIR